MLVLGVGGTRDTVTLPYQLGGQLEPWTGNGLTLRMLNTGHWMKLEGKPGTE
jgi:hypothetical protein